jgi:hypothetical protein
VQCADYRDSLTEHCNFETFGMALLTLMRVSTNDAWSVLAADLAVQPPKCDRELGDCGPPVIVVNMYLVCAFLVDYCLPLVGMRSMLV